jgi:putative peptidoglycan lipid II flippase
LAKTVALGDHVGFRKSLARGMRLAFVLTIPASVGLIILAEPIIGLLYQRGASTPHDTAQAAAALQFYALGLVAYSGIKVLAPAFYAIDKRKTPMIVSFFAIAVNLGLNWLFTFRMGLGHRGLALSTGCVAMTNFAVLYVLMRVETRYLETRAMLRTLGKLALPTALLALACWASQTFVIGTAAHHGLLIRAAALLATIGVAGALFFGAALMFKLEEIDEIALLFKRRLGRFLPKQAS